MVELPQQRAHQLSRLLEPTSVAVIGASETGLGGTVVANLRRDFPGKIFAVNSRRDTVQGLTTYRTVDDLPDGIDLLIFLVPAAVTPEIAERAARRDFGGALVLSAGFAEAGESGVGLQERLTVLDSSGFPVIGPNCNGVHNAFSGLSANFILRPEADRHQAGPIAIVSQSGGFGGYLLARAVAAGLRVGWYITTGNEAGVNVSDVLEWIVEDPRVEVVLCFHEAVRSPDVFIRAARRANELGKAIVTMKAGTSEQGSKAAMSHTASVVGSAAVYEAVAEQVGIVRAHSIDQLLDFGIVLQAGRKLDIESVGILSVSGGSGVVMADAADAVGISVPTLHESTQERINALMPSPNYGSATNPVDTTGMMRSVPEENFSLMMDAILDDPAIGAAAPLLFGGSTWGVVDSFRRTTKPFVAAVTHIDPELVAAGVPAFPDPVRAVQSLSALKHRGTPQHTYDPTSTEVLEQAGRIIASSRDYPFMLEDDAKALFALYGITVSREEVLGSDDTDALLARVGNGAVALKALSYELPHKSDVGGVQLGLRSSNEIATAQREMEARLDEILTLPVERFLIQEMVPATIEIVVGMNCDPTFGPVIAIGLGGLQIELGEQPVLLLPPFTAGYAVSRIRALGRGKLVGAQRGLTEAGAGAVAALAVQLGHLVLDLPEIGSIDINPVRVHGGRAVAVDGLMTWRHPSRRASHDASN